MEIQNPNLIAKEYINVINVFKKRYDVQNGTALGYRKNQDPDEILLDENKPAGIGDGLATTGWCVSASQALLLDNVFQYLLQSRNALAKLVSIDIKEQFYGYCYSGSQNKWHTAILVCDSGYNFIIDITCKQFGNAYADKLIWDFSTWEKTFRSPNDKHVILGFDNMILSNLPSQTTVLDKKISDIGNVNRLHDITTITDDERQTLSDFFNGEIQTINNKILLGNINKFDYVYIDKINKLLKNLDFVKVPGIRYFVMEFNSIESAKSWIKNLSDNDFILQQYITLSEKIDDNCKYFGINPNNINKENGGTNTYIVLELNNIDGMSLEFLNDVDLLIPFGIKLNIDLQSGIFNGGKLLSNTADLVERKTNTIYIRGTF